MSESARKNKKTSVASAAKKKSLSCNDKPNSGKWRGILKSANKDKEQIVNNNPVENGEEHKIQIAEPNIILKVNDDTMLVEEIQKKEEKKFLFELPPSLCPSSLKFSKKLGVSQWIENTNFETSSRIKPLI